MGSFGATIPVTTLNVGFLGAVSRIGKRTITARQVLSTSATGPSFGDPCVLVPTNGGGDTMQSVKDYIAAGGTFAASKFAGVAVREVKTNLSYVAMETIGTGQIGSYGPGEMGEILEEGSCTVKINVGTPLSQNPLHVRVALDGTIPAGVVGGFEATADTNPISTTMGTTSGSAVIAVASATGITVGSIVAGAGIPVGSSVLSISGTNVTISANATATAASGVAVIFTHTVQLSGVVFRTGVIDGNNASEITILNRVAA